MLTSRADALKETPTWGKEPTFLGLYMQQHSLYNTSPAYQSLLGSRPLIDNMHPNQTEDSCF